MDRRLFSGAIISTLLVACGEAKFAGYIADPRFTTKITTEVDNSLPPAAIPTTGGVAQKTPEPVESEQVDPTQDECELEPGLPYCPGNSEIPGTTPTSGGGTTTPTSGGGTTTPTNSGSSTSGGGGTSTNTNNTNTNTGGGSTNTGGGGTTTPTVTKVCPTNPEVCPKVMDFFTPDSSLPGSVDIIWSVDSSGSMDSKRQIVQNNIRNFMTKISQYSSQKIALITRNPFLPTVSGVSTLNVNAYVNSQMAMTIAAGASCPSTWSTTGQNFTGSTRVCNKTINWGYENSSYNLADAAGCLINGMNPARSYTKACPLAYGQKFLRDNVKRVYVFVTDDDNVGYTSGDFLSQMIPLMNGGDAKMAECEKTNSCNIPLGFVFGSKPESRTQCRATAVSNNYVNLVRWTGTPYGSATGPYPFYNVCTSDWTPYFDHMMKLIQGSTLDSFTLSQTPIAGNLSVRALRTYYVSVPDGKGGYVIKEDTTKRTAVTSTDKSANRLLVEGVDYTLSGRTITLRRGAITLPTKPNEWGEVVRAFYIYQ